MACNVIPLAFADKDFWSVPWKQQIHDVAAGKRDINGNEAGGRIRENGRCRVSTKID